MCRIGSRRWRASPATRSATISARRSSPRARCACASIRLGNLSVVDVAKIAFVTGLTFWLGNIVRARLRHDAGAGGRERRQPIAAWVNQVVGAAGARDHRRLLALAAAAAARSIGRGDWAVTLPSARLTLVQIGIGVLDLAAGGLAMYMLLPPDPSVDFITVLVIFVTATLLGFLSHAPGSLGVFEAAMLIALPQFEKEELAGLAADLPLSLFRAAAGAWRSASWRRASFGFRQRLAEPGAEQIGHHHRDDDDQHLRRGLRILERADALAERDNLKNHAVS